ncbi:hypothetical protein CYMTET_35605 [Cymbomonas tetramitiformis]|uniref:RING-type domain-containing protein n=1 Tax=Cymbomonas tetramitiformis TaxID=36881 RepID=A0AAE0F8R2_9CHLO|nr:hypothetical protein CYMTET_35605 [Cymbomonas tetramitiformis]|eukprot:gene13-19_t
MSNTAATSGSASFVPAPIPNDASPQIAAKAVTGEVLEKAIEALHCVICLETIVDAHALAGCGHCFCGNCIFEWFDATADNKTCPTCRKNVNVSPMENVGMEKLVELTVVPCLREEDKLARQARKTTSLAARKVRDANKPVRTPTTSVSGRGRLHTVEAVQAFMASHARVRRVEPSSAAPGTRVRMQLEGTGSIISQIQRTLQIPSRVRQPQMQGATGSRRQTAARMRAVQAVSPGAAATNAPANTGTQARVARAANEEAPLITYSTKHRECGTCRGLIDKRDTPICYKGPSDDQFSRFEWHHFQCYADAHLEWSGEHVTISPELNEIERMRVETVLLHAPRTRPSAV